MALLTITDILLCCLWFRNFLNILQILFIITLQMLSKIYDETQKTYLNDKNHT
jgi:hypothetical protein